MTPPTPKKMQRITPAKGDMRNTKSNITLKKKLTPLCAAAKEKSSARTERSPAAPVKVERPRTKTAPDSIKKSNEIKQTPLTPAAPGSARKTWKRRPQNAHSGVPVPEKMKKLMQSKSSYAKKLL